MEESADNSAALRQELNEIPVFPLPNAVLLPESILPLHLFEARYCAMLKDCLRDERKTIAIALLNKEGGTDAEGRPAIHPIAGVGRIVENRTLADSTFNIVLQGLRRVHLEELSAGERPYRIAHATALRDEPPEMQGTEAGIPALLSCAASVVTAVRREYPEFELDVNSDDPPGRIADLIADRLLTDPEQRQRILETLNVKRRVQLVTEAAGEMLAVIWQPGRSGKKPRRLD